MQATCCLLRYANKLFDLTMCLKCALSKWKRDANIVQYTQKENLDFYHVSSVYEHESNIKSGGSRIKKGELVLNSWESTWIKL